jgi:ABC-2 type transport system ATP-binding protein
VTAAILAEHLQKRYGDVQAVRDVSFEVAPGEVFGLLGPNGAGKSTTVRMLVTLTRPSGGRALVAGHDVAREGRRVRASMGYVAQSPGTDRYLTGRENLLLQARAHGLGRRAALARSAELLELFGLAHAADRLVVTYSGGMRRRVELAMGLVHRPQVLFLDEPTTGLDPEVRAALWVELSRLAAAEGLTILLTTHSMEEAERLADRLAVVAGGRVVVQGAPEVLKRGVGGDTIAVQLAGERLDEARRAVAGLAGVREASAEGGALRAVVADGPRALPALLAALEARGIAVTAASVSRPTLDDVYLHHAGHAFPSWEGAS